MEVRPVALFAVMSAIGAALLIVMVMATPGTTFVTSGNFDFSQILPTSLVSSANPQGCGTSVTQSLSFPPRIAEVLTYYPSVNASGEQVNWWINVSEPLQHYNGTFAYPTHSESALFVGDGAVSTVTFTFQGCAPFLGAPFEFQGGYHTNSTNPS